MSRFIATFLLFIFSLLNVVTVYGAYKNGMETTIALIEEDENHLEVLEVKKYLKDDNAAFEAFVLMDYTSNHLVEYRLKEYEDVLLASVETPPDHIC